MKWKDLKLSGKFTYGFGTIIVLISAVILFAIKGIGGIVNNAEEVIEGNKLRTDIEEKYVQHLNWATEVNKLLTDDSITDLNVQLDPTRCAFGMWYYGEGRKDAEKLAPGLKPILDQMEDPHMKLHESAKKIKDVFHQADYQLSAMLRDAKTDHLNFMHNVKNVVLANRTVNRIDVIKDPTQCRFGKWLYADEIKAHRAANAEFDQLCSDIEGPHNKLHQEIKVMENYYRSGNLDAGRNFFLSTIQPTTDNVLKELDKLIAWNDVNLEGMKEANTIHTNSSE